MTHDREEGKGNSQGNNVNSAIGLDVTPQRNKSLWPRFDETCIHCKEDFGSHIHRDCPDRSGREFVSILSAPKAD